MIIALICALLFLFAIPMVLTEGGVVKQARLPRWTLRTGMIAFVMLVLLIFTEVVFKPALAVDLTPQVVHMPAPQPVFPGHPLVVETKIVTKTRTVIKHKVVVKRIIVPRLVYVAPPTSFSSIRTASALFSPTKGKGKGRGKK